MAACNLELQLSEPDKIYIDGENVRGEVIVQVDKAINCKSLEVASVWTTHGRGNIDRGEVASVTLFSGSWQAGTYRYPFELRTATWPPTYHGRLLNISHQVQSRAKLSWAIDPKAMAEITVQPTCSPADLSAVNNLNRVGPGVIGWTVIGILLALVGVMFIFLVPILLLIAGVIWFFSAYLPKLRTGTVECVVEPARLRAGQSLRGRMEFTPKVKTRINGVRYTVMCEEKCVSGSGSNRQTHREELLSQEEYWMGPGELLPGQKQSFQFEYTLPLTAPPSLDLSDNDLNWYIEYRIDIPRWPDFHRKLPLVVELPPRVTKSQLPPVVSGTLASEDWYAQVVAQLLDSVESPDRLRLVLQAIQGHEFDVAWEVDRPVPAPHEQLADGQWFLSSDPQHDVNFALHVPLAKTVSAAPRAGNLWHGRVSIIGFDPTHHRLIARVL